MSRDSAGAVISDRLNSWMPQCATDFQPPVPAARKWRWRRGGGELGAEPRGVRTDRRLSAAKSRAQLGPSKGFPGPTMAQEEEGRD